MFVVISLVATRSVSSFVTVEYKIGHFVKRQGSGMIYGVYKPYLPTVLILLVFEKSGTSHVHLLWPIVCSFHRQYQLQFCLSSSGSLLSTFMPFTFCFQVTVGGMSDACTVDFLVVMNIHIQFFCYYYWNVSKGWLRMCKYVFDSGSEVSLRVCFKRLRLIAQAFLINFSISFVFRENSESWWKPVLIHFANTLLSSLINSD